MATIADISQELGDYMLRGWVLTDQSCPTVGCSVPLLRSPKSKTPITTLCVKCNRDKFQENTAPAISSPSNASSEPPESRSSTPPTEFSAAPESPLFVPLPDTEVIRRRREQSDQASSAIGKKLLQGWAMLGDECPNDSCYGVPLVRPPKSGGEKDPRKECVICGNIYTTEVDWAGREALVPFESKGHIKYSSALPAQTSTLHSQIGQISSPAPNRLPFVSSFTLDSNENAPLKSTSHLLKPAVQEAHPVSTLSLGGLVLEDTSRALQTSLQALSGRLASASSNLNALDPVSIGATADAIGKVVHALAQIRQLQSAEIHGTPITQL